MWHEVSRRNFLTAGTLASAVFLTSGCSLFGITTSRETIGVVQNDLFPKAKALGINTSKYITIIYRHRKVAQWEKDFLKNGVKWLNESAIEVYKKRYTSLSPEKRQKVLKTISETEWGSSWIDSMMHYIFEAMLGDPIYSGNQNFAGWKWLEFEGGKPRAKKVYLG